MCEVEGGRRHQHIMRQEKERLNRTNEWGKAFSFVSFPFLEFSSMCPETETVLTLQVR